MRRYLYQQQHQYDSTLPESPHPTTPIHLIFTTKLPTTFYVAHTALAAFLNSSSVFSVLRTPPECDVALAELYFIGNDPY